ncbi:MAG: diacylglycerol kinase [Gammaproteobacteria bacterium]
MAKTGATGLRRIINAAGYSWKGIKAAYTSEAAFRQEAWCCIVLVPVALYFANSLPDKLLLIASLLLVLVVELLNSALEAVVDRVGAEHHPLSGRAKDMGSAAVLFAIVIAVLVWIAVLL